MFNFNHLYYFYITTKYGGVTKAAKFLRIAQPSLSAQLRTLENAIDFKLFRREGRVLALTDEGVCVYGYCQKMFDAAEDLKTYIAKMRKYTGKGITVAVAYEVPQPISSDLVSQLFASTKEFSSKIRIISGHPTEVVEWLQKGEVNAIITHFNPEDSGFKIIGEILSPVYLYTGLQFASMITSLLHSEVPDILKKIDVGLVLPYRDCAMRGDVDQFLRKNNLQNPIAFESDILNTCIQAIAEGMGVGFLPSLYLDYEISNHKVFRLGSDRPLWHHRIYLAVANGTENESWLNHLKLKFEDREEPMPQLVESLNSFKYVKK